MLGLPAWQPQLGSKIRDDGSTGKTARHPTPSSIKKTLEAILRSGEKDKLLAALCGC